MNEKKKLITTDFDGTLTTHDTLLLFIRYAKGTKAFYKGFMAHLWLLVLMKLGWKSNEKVKEQLFSYYFKGTEISKFNEICCNFAHENSSIMRPKALKMLREAQKDETIVAVVTASIDNWVKPFFSEVCPNAIVVGTQIEVKDGIVTGSFASKNCYGAEKVNRIKELFPDREQYHITAYGDSSGDSEMLKYADIQHYKPFRT